MNCFEHVDVPAVGICKICNKGLCKRCVVGLGHAITCKGDCESEAVALQAQILKNRAIIQAGEGNRYMTPAIYAIIGFVLLFIDIYARGWRLSPMVLFGIGIVGFSLYMLRVSYQWGREYDSDDDR